MAVELKKVYLNYERNKRSDNAPDFWGEIEFTGDVVAHLANCLRNNQPAKLRMAGWKEQNKNGPYISLQFTEPQRPPTGGGTGRSPNQRFNNGGSSPQQGGWSNNNQGSGNWNGQQQQQPPQQGGFDAPGGGWDAGGGPNDPPF